jgi:hypothetical protein
MITIVLLILFFALVWHDEPSRPPVIERRRNWMPQFLTHQKKQQKIESRYNEVVHAND